MFQSIRKNLVALITLVFALSGFSYNAWRLELSEINNNLRTASFQILLELGELEQIVFAAHYDKDPKAGNPRVGWVKIGMVNDFSVLLGADVHAQADRLKSVWQTNWQGLGSNEAQVKLITDEIDATRKITLQQIEVLD